MHSKAWVAFVQAAVAISFASAHVASPSCRVGHRNFVHRTSWETLVIPAARTGVTWSKKAFASVLVELVDACVGAVADSDFCHVSSESVVNVVALTYSTEKFADAQTIKQYKIKGNGPLDATIFE